MRGFAWCCVILGILLAIAVPLGADVSRRAFLDSSDHTAWLVASGADRFNAWQPPKLRTALYWESWRWPAVVGGSGLSAFGILLLAIRKPQRAAP
jgi:hypothetical protein